MQFCFDQFVGRFFPSKSIDGLHPNSKQAMRNTKNKNYIENKYIDIELELNSQLKFIQLYNVYTWI